MSNTSTSLVKEDRRFIISCIHVYRDLTALWNVKSKDYSVRKNKNYTFEILHQKYKEKYPEVGREDVKKKYNSLRETRKREREKHKMLYDMTGNKADRLRAARYWAIY
jgi:hypothetical protein